MVGIWSKIKNGFNWIKDHIVKPVVNTVKKVTHNPFVQKIVDWGSSFIPFGGALKKGFDIAGKVSEVADDVVGDHDRGGFEGIAQKAMTGGYNNSLRQIQPLNRFMQSMSLAKKILMN